MIKDGALTLSNAVEVTLAHQHFCFALYHLFLCVIKGFGGFSKLIVAVSFTKIKKKRLCEAHKWKKNNFGVFAFGPKGLVILKLL